MAVVLVSFETDNDYSDSELETFTEAFKDFLSEMDEDAKTSSIEIQTMTEAEAETATHETVKEFIENSEISATLVITHPDHEKPIVVEFSAEGE